MAKVLLILIFGISSGSCVKDASTSASFAAFDPVFQRYWAAPAIRIDKRSVTHRNTAIERLILHSNYQPVLPWPDGKRVLLFSRS